MGPAYSRLEQQITAFTFLCIIIENILTFAVAAVGLTGTRFLPLLLYNE